MRRLFIAVLLSGSLFAGSVLPVMAHPHIVSNPDHDQLLANGQNHPGFVGNISCEGVNEPANSGPAGYGLETAHHGPDSGTSGKADGCYQRDGAPDDNNPAID